MEKTKEKGSLDKPIGTVTRRNEPNIKRMAQGIISVYTRYGATYTK
ncbi:hypothetical protein V7068_21240 [Bacillus sp. JJ634]